MSQAPRERRIGRSIMGSPWYPLALIVVALRQAWLGGVPQRKTQPIT